jgi:hypothetical protein
MPTSGRRMWMRFVARRGKLHCVNFETRLSLSVVPLVSPRFNNYSRSTSTARSLLRVSTPTRLLPMVLPSRVVFFPENKALKMWSSWTSARSLSVLRPPVGSSPSSSLVTLSSPLASLRCMCLQVSNGIRLKLTNAFQLLNCR